MIENEKVSSVDLNSRCHFFLLFFRKRLCARGGSTDANSRDLTPEHTKQCDIQGYREWGKEDQHFVDG